MSSVDEAAVRLVGCDDERRRAAAVGTRERLQVSRLVAGWSVRQLKRRGLCGQERLPSVPCGRRVHGSPSTAASAAAEQSAERAAASRRRHRPPPDTTEGASSHWSSNVMATLLDHSGFVVGADAEWQGRRRLLPLRRR